MKIRNYFIFTYMVFIIFAFFYTLTDNLHLNSRINIINMLILFIIFIFWLFSWYLAFIKDIFKSNERERKGISLVLVLSGILFFFYNPFYKPDGYYVEIYRPTYFLITLIFFISFYILAKGKDFFISGILALIPITIQSFSLNILKYDKFFLDFPYFTPLLIIFLIVIYHWFRVFKK